MSELSRADLRRVLDLFGVLGDPGSPDPFSTELLTQLQEITGADSGVGYVETPLEMSCESYAVLTRPQPPWLSAALDEVGRQDPIHAAHSHTATAPVAISDKLTAREFHRLEVYRRVCEPLGTADSMRLYLPAPGGSARFFFFDRSQRGFPVRTRRVLQLLRPHLVRARSQYPDDLQTTPLISLTERQTTIMEWVARGASNAEIGRRLCISEHTVRKHLENIFTQLHVHSRSAAVAALRGPASLGPRMSSSPGGAGGSPTDDGSHRL